MKTSIKVLISIGSILGLILFGLLVFRVMFITLVNNYERAFLWEKKTGEITRLVNEDGSPKIGYVFAWPILNKVYTVDTRPTQICISANSRVLNCKLVRFNEDGYKELFAWHGLKNYVLDVTSSNPPTGSFKDILMSYAYDPTTTCTFITILKENAQDIRYDVVSDSLTTK